MQPEGSAEFRRTDNFCKSRKTGPVQGFRFHYKKHRKLLKRKDVYKRQDLDAIIPRLKAYTTGKVVEKVTCHEKEILEGKGPKVALMDFGAKRNIARSLNERGCQVTIYPALTPAEEILKDNPDGIMLSNGPGDPKECTSIIEEIRKLYESDVPIFADVYKRQVTIWRKSFPIMQQGRR